MSRSCVEAFIIRLPVDNAWHGELVIISSIPGMLRREAHCFFSSISSIKLTHKGDKCEGRQHCASVLHAGGGVINSVGDRQAR